jgi:hypothetical protein
MKGEAMKTNWINNKGVQIDIHRLARRIRKVLCSSAKLGEIEKAAIRSSSDMEVIGAYLYPHSEGEPHEDELVWKVLDNVTGDDDYLYATDWLRTLPRAERIKLINSGAWRAAWLADGALKK